MQYREIYTRRERILIVESWRRGKGVYFLVSHLFFVIKDFQVQSWWGENKTETFLLEFLSQDSPTFSVAEYSGYKCRRGSRTAWARLQSVALNQFLNPPQFLHLKSEMVTVPTTSGCPEALMS